MAFRMYLTDTDHKVLQFVEEMGSITISQCQRIFYNTQKYGYDIARKRLGKLVQYKKLEVNRDNVTSQNVYYMEKKKRKHDLLVLDYYSQLIFSGANIIYFNAEQQWINGTFRSDAYCCYILKDKIYYNILEVVRTSGVDENKYKQIYESGEAHYLNNEMHKQIIEFNKSYEQFGGEEHKDFPRLIIIDNVNHKKQLEISSYINAIQLDHNFTNFPIIFA